MTAHFEKLRNGYTFTLGGRLLPGAGGYSLGAVTPVIADESGARAWLTEMADVLAPLSKGAAEIVPVGDPWKFMRRAAGEGIAGIALMDKDGVAGQFMFMVRVEEAGTALPTVLASITKDGWDACLTRAGVKRLAHSDVLHWQRFDILDQISGTWGQRCPFRAWEHGDPLYELRSNSLVVLLSDAPLLGHWNSTDGAFTFFTSEELALHYQHHHLADGRNRMLFIASSDPRGPDAAIASLRPQPVSDLRIRLEELRAINPFAAWCVNPVGHREDAGCGRLLDGVLDRVREEEFDYDIAEDDDSVAEDLDYAIAGDDDTAAQDAAPRMKAVSGIWKVMPGNIFELEKPMAPWTGTDTIRWSGGQSLQLLPLDRSFMLEPLIAALEFDAEVSEAEAEEVITAYLDSIGLEESCQQLDQTTDSAADDNLDQFYVVCWDAVTGEREDYPWQFPGFLAALRHLAAYEREHDRNYRAVGAASCSHIGFAGSGNAEAEGLRSERFQLGLRRLGMRVARRGYRPSDAGDLVALCNSVLSTLHVDYAGFAKDLLWAIPSDQQDDLLDALGIEEQQWREWANGADVPFDPAGRKLVVDRIGEAAWNQLLPKVRHFLATALLHLEDQGHAPQLDYAPISLEVVKALEVELGEILEKFRRSVQGQALAHDDQDTTDQGLTEFLAGGKMPSLGSFRYLFKKLPKQGASELRMALHHFLSGFSNAAFLTSPKFVNRDLPRVTNKYRNGGAHDSPISEETCRKCVDDLVGSLDSPGYIPLVIGWKV